MPSMVKLNENWGSQNQIKSNDELNISLFLFSKMEQKSQPRILNLYIFIKPLALKIVILFPDNKIAHFYPRKMDPTKPDRRIGCSLDQEKF